MQVEAAHLCYLVGGVLPQVYDASARMCLLGADHRSAPHTLASLPALQRTEVLEWAKLPGAHSLCLSVHHLNVVVPCHHVVEGLLFFLPLKVQGFINTAVGRVSTDCSQDHFCITRVS